MMHRPFGISPNSPAVFSKIHADYFIDSHRSSCPGSPSASVRSSLQPSTPASGPTSPMRTKQGCHSPYGFAVIPMIRSIPAQPLPPPAAPSSPPSYDAAQGHSTASAPTSSPTGAVAHNFLRGKCQLLALPPNLTDTVVEDHAALSTLSFQIALPQPIFIGQVRYETTAAEINWLLLTVVGVRALKIESRGKGCFAVLLRCEEDALLVKTLHKTLLFDYHGVWFARTPEECDILANYARGLSQPHSARNRLPKDCVVIEEQRVRSSQFQHVGLSHHAARMAAMDATAPQSSTISSAAIPVVMRPPPSYMEAVHCGSTPKEHAYPPFFGATASPQSMSLSSRSNSGEPSPMMVPKKADSDPMTPVLVEPPSYRYAM